MDINALTRAAMTDKALVAMFVRTQCTLGEGLYVSKDALHSAYLVWSKRQGKDYEMPMPTFGRYVLGTNPMVGTARRRVGGERVWFFLGLSLNEY